MLHLLRVGGNGYLLYRQPNLIKTHAKMLYRLEQNDRAVALLEKAMDMASDKADFVEVLKQMKEKKL